MNVVKWVSWKYADKNCIRDDSDEKEGSLCQYLRSTGIKFSGVYHQNGRFGVPMFEDGSVLMCTMRHWGGLMARAHDIDQSEMSYCNFAWDCVESRFPYSEVDMK